MSCINSCIVGSSSMTEFMMRMMLGGYAVRGEEEGVDMILSALFGDDCDGVPSLYEKELEKSAFHLLAHVKNSVCLLNKGRYGRVMLGFLQYIYQHTFISLSAVNESVGPYIDRIMKLSEIMAKLDENFIPSLRDGNGNNILMLLVNAFKFEDVMRYIGRVSYSKAVMDEFLKNQYSLKLFKFFVREMKCDPYEKNNQGRSLASYFSDDFIHGELGFYRKTS